MFMYMQQFGLRQAASRQSSTNKVEVTSQQADGQGSYDTRRHIAAAA
jgi:hypothetical protein